MSHDANDWWDRTIDRNRKALLRLVAVLFLFAGLDEGGADFVPRRVWRRIVRLLRPAEAALRRLIVIAARGIALSPVSCLGGGDVQKGQREASAPNAKHPSPSPQASTAMPFRLTDPPPCFDALGWDGERPFPEDGVTLSDPDEAVNIRHLCRRLLSLKHALDTIDEQAKRLARWKARQTRFPGRLGRSSPLRRGWPPSLRKRPAREIDDILNELHAMALHSEAPNSS